ncbi:MAG TPA: hypothetical protein DD435_14515 [Cyanobacteria bacterium UBA8530]|nr:hypothetical protein [Cyanobacteria bacterium UBA8530]
MSSSGFNVSGIASGLDWKTMVDQMMALERNPVIRLQTRKKSLQDKNSAYQDINTKLLNLDKAIGDLMLDSNLKPKKASVNSPTVAGATSPTLSVSAVATSDAPVGDYAFSVTQLATASTVTSLGKNAGRLGTDITQARADGLEKLSALNFSQSVTSGTMNISINGNETISISVDTLNDTLKNVFDRISTATGGRVTGSVADNKIVLTTLPSVTSISVGTGLDTSNFATAAFLNTSSLSGGAVTSTRIVSAAQLGRSMDLGGIQGLAPGTAGNLKINGVEIAYDSSVDSLNNLIGRINSSEANVLASYDAINDKLKLTSKTTGATEIAVSDSGALLASTGLFETQTKGQNARLKLADGTVLESTTNTFTNIAAGLSVTALAVSPDDTAIPGEKLKTTVSVDADVEGFKTKVKAFVDEFNKVADAIDQSRGKGQKLAFDGTLGDIRNRLFSTVSGTVSGLTGDPNSLLAIGIGTSNSDRNHLSIDDTKLTNAFNKDPDRVSLLFKKQTTTYKVDGSIDKITSDGLAAKLNDYIDVLRGSQGFFKIIDTSTTDQTKALDNNIKQLESRLALRKTNMVKKFTAMEMMVSTMKSQQSAMISQLNSLG